MDDNVFTEADASAPELEATAAIEPVENTTPEEQSAEQEAPKTFSQEDLDAIVGKRLAREQRKWEREQAQRAEEMQARQQPIHDITPEQFETYEDYAEVLAERKAEEMLVRRERDTQQRAMLESYHEREEAARDKYDDFEQVKKTTTAPAPIAPVTARTSGAPAFDTTDPRSIKSMSTSEWIEADRLRQIKKLEAQRNR
jgi:hypothetical protein